MSNLPQLYRNNFLPNPFTVSTTFYNNASFNTYISGRVLEKDSRLVNEAIVTLFEAHSMTPVAATTTYNQGFFRFLSLDPNLEYLIVAKDRSNQNYNAVIIDRVKPSFYDFMDETYPDLSAKPIREVIVYPDVIINEPSPNNFLSTKITFRSIGAYDTKRLSTWSSTDITFKENASGVTGTFNGSTSGVYSESAPFLNFENDFTLSFFINIQGAPSSNSTGYFLLTNYTGLTSSTFSLVLTKDLKLTLVKNTNVLFTSITTFALDTWYEVTLSREDSKRVSLFVNGIKEIHLDNEEIITFAPNGVAIGYSPTNLTAYPRFNGIIQSIDVYNKAIYSRDFGLSSALSNLQLFNENLKFAVLFEEDIKDIASNILFTHKGLTLSFDDYDSGVSSVYCLNPNLKVQDTLLNINSEDDFTLEFAIKPIQRLVEQLDTYSLVRLGSIKLYVDSSNKLRIITGQYDNITEHDSLSFTSFNSIRISRKQSVIGIFINDVLQIKIRDSSAFSDIEFFFEDNISTAVFEGYFDTVKFYPKYINYDFNNYIDDSVDIFRSYCTNDFNFKNTFTDSIAFNSFSVNGTLYNVTNKCVSPPQSLYKLNTAGLTISSMFRSGRPWTMEGWFCLGTTRSGAYYTLFDGSNTNSTLSTHGQFFAIDASSFKLKYYRGSTISKTSAAQVYTYDGHIFQVGEWFHFAAEFNNITGLTNLYLNFEKIASLEIPYGWDHENSNKFNIGYSDFSSNDTGFSGWIDDVKIYKGVSKYSIPLSSYLWHPWYNMKNLIDATFLPESLVYNPDIIESQYLQTWTDLYRSYNLTQSTLANRPLVYLEDVTPCIKFNGTSSYLALSTSLDTLYNKNRIYSYFVFKVDEIESQTPSKRTISSSYQNALTIHNCQFDISLGDGINLENNNKLIYNSRGYVTNSSAYKAFTIVSNESIEAGKWYAVRCVANMSNRTMHLYINGGLDKSLSNAFYSNSNTITWATKDYNIGRNAMEIDTYFNGYLAAYFVGSSSSVPAEKYFYAMDRYFANIYNFDLPEDHMYKNTQIYLENV